MVNPTEAHRIAAQVNGSTPDLRTERAELANINAQINNGLKAILSGMDIPELQDEMGKLRGQYLNLRSCRSAA